MTIEAQEKKIIEQLLPLYAMEEARSLACWVIMDVCRMNRSQLLIHKQSALSAEEVVCVDHILSELKTGKPIQYILSVTEFYGLKLHVDSSVLIPRPETEELVAWILSITKSVSLGSYGSGVGAPPPLEKTRVRLLDIGTGSGCIPIALKKNLPNASVFAVDISASALMIARENAICNEVEVQFIQDDILNPCSEILDQRYDVIVSNPPYVRLSEKSDMHVNVLDYEPHLALFVPDNNALLFYDQIADFALVHLNDQGFLFFEINERFGQQTIDLLVRKGFQEIELRKDIRGKDRMLKATYSR
ncbi:MAG: peptide chain release factor N(5)-glutamine methyltransferase [Sphingobacteriaceae bacterium]|nr:MAG: peptide chain release factor N(5)-glutamine methyltransferase [Pedobacter sp.]